MPSAKRSRYDDATEDVVEEAKVPKNLAAEADSLDVSMTANFPLRRVKDSKVDGDGKKGKRQKSGKSTDAVASDPEKQKSAALDYLKLWKKSREEWKFQKLKQIWLLRNIYKTDLISDKNFSRYLLPYLEKLNGKAKETTLAEAQKLMETTEESNDSHQRAKQIVQLFADLSPA